MFMDNLHLMNLRPNKWLKSSRLPVTNDIVVFVFNDSNYAKESVVWRLGRVAKVEKTKVSIVCSTKANSTEHTLTRSVRDISIVYSVGELMVNTVDHFDECAQSFNASE